MVGAIASQVGMYVLLVFLAFHVFLTEALPVFLFGMEIRQKLSEPTG